MGEVLRHRIGAGRSRLLLVAFVLAVLLGIRVDTAKAATFTVCPAGPPNCQYSTVADAVAAAGDGDRVSVAPGTYAGGFTIAHSILLVGSGQGETLIAGGDPTGITIAPGVSVTIRAVAVTGAAWTGIENDGDLIVRAASISDNNPTHQCNVLFNVAGVLNNGTLLASDTEISRNYVCYGYAAAILNFGRATVQRSTVSQNVAIYGAGAIENSGSSLVVRDSTFESNAGAQGSSAIQTSTFTTGDTNTLIVNTRFANNAGEDGPIINYGGTLTLRRSTITLSQTFAGGNHAVIENWNPASMVIRDTSIDNNTGRGIDNFGGVMTLHSSSVTNNLNSGIRNSASMTVRDSTVQGNTGSGISNGGSMTVRDSTVQGNTASSGGGIANEGTLFLRGSTVSGNTATNGVGGGIVNYEHGNLTLRSSVVTGNTALGFPGGNEFGGGIFNYPLGTVTLRQSVVSGNTPDDCVGCSGSFRPGHRWTKDRRHLALLRH